MNKINDIMHNKGLESEGVRQFFMSSIYFNFLNLNNFFLFNIISFNYQLCSKIC